MDVYITATPLGCSVVTSVTICVCVPKESTKQSGIKPSTFQLLAECHEYRANAVFALKRDGTKLNFVITQPVLLFLKNDAYCFSIIRYTVQF